MFDLLEVGLETIATLRGPLDELRKRDADLFRQIRRAASSITLNIAEGNRRQGADRLHLWRVAAGSADEVRVGLRCAVAWGDLRVEDTERSLELLDRICAMLWRLTH